MTPHDQPLVLFSPRFPGVTMTWHPGVCDQKQMMVADVDNDKEVVTLMVYQQRCEMVLPLEQTLWELLQRLRGLPNYTIHNTPDTYMSPQRTLCVCLYKDICFSIVEVAKQQKQPKYLSTGETKCALQWTIITHKEKKLSF